MPVKRIANSAINQIPNNVIEAALLNCLTLLDSIRSPKTSNTKKGIPIKIKREIDNNHLGSVAS